MGIFLSCCKPSDPSYNTPTDEERRKQMSEAAEKRLREQEQRGLRDAASVRRIEQARERSQKMEDTLDKDTQGPLRWQVS